MEYFRGSESFSPPLCWDDGTVRTCAAPLRMSLTKFGDVEGGESSGAEL